jgi:hypothetical protein
LIEIIVEPNVRRRRGRRPLSAKKKAAALFRVWHGVRALIVQPNSWATANGAFPGLWHCWSRSGPMPPRRRAFDRSTIAAELKPRTWALLVPGVERVAQTVA